MARRGTAKRFSNRTSNEGGTPCAVDENGSLSDSIVMSITVFSVIRSFLQTSGQTLDISIFLFSGHDPRRRQPSAVSAAATLNLPRPSQNWNTIQFSNSTRLQTPITIDVNSTIKDGSSRPPHGRSRHVHLPQEGR